MNVASRFLIACALAACSDQSVRNHDSGPGEMDSGFDAGRDAQVGPTESWYATKTTLDVWWQGVPTRDPGRGIVTIYALTKARDACDDDYEPTIKICSLTFPPYTSDVSCEASQLEIADSAWNSTSMPRFTARAFNDIDAGAAATTITSALIGIDLRNGEERSSWPSTRQAIACEAGTGVACFPDHDDDSWAGVTAQVRNDGATYVGPYDNGLCTNTSAYKFRGVLTMVDISAGGGGFDGARAERVRLGLRMISDAPPNGTCLNAPRDSRSARFDLRAVDCAIDPTTAHSSDPRIASMDTTCTPNEARFVDDNLPQYRVLGAGETPGDSLRPLGWELAGRDIDKSVSNGTRAVTVRLNGDVEPTCAQVRAAAFPAP